MANINKELNQIKNAVYGKDVRQAIHDGIEKAYNDATSGGAGDTNLEVVLARGNYDSLNKRLDASDSQLAETATKDELNNSVDNLENEKMDKDTTDISITQINKNKGLIDETYLSDELKEQMAGNTPIHSVPADNSITTMKLSQNAVSPPKTDFLELDKDVNLYDGNFLMASLLGNAAESGFSLSSSQEFKTARIIVKPDTVYSVIREPDSVSLKIGTDTIVNRDYGDKFEGSISVQRASDTDKNFETFTTGSDDVVLYVQYKDALVQVVEGIQESLTISGYSHIPNNKLDVYSKKEIDNKKFNANNMEFLESETLFDGNYIRKTLRGSPSDNQLLYTNPLARTAKIHIKPNTTYSVIREPSSIFKISTDTIADREYGRLEGSVNIVIPGSSSTYHSTFTTGPNDVVLYVHYTGQDEDIYLEIVEGVRSMAKYKDYTFSPTKNINVYTKEEVDYLVDETTDIKQEKILFVSNSFGYDSIQWVGNIAKSVGLKSIVANAHLSGADLETNYNNAVNNEGVYSYRKIIDGSINNSSDMTIKEILQDEDWGVVVVQQASAKAHDYSTYQPFLGNLVEWIKQNSTNGNVRIGINAIWSYSEDGSANHTPLIQWEQIIESCKSAAKEEDLHFILPTGTAIQNARTKEDLSSVGDELTRDGYHLNFGIGRYIASLVVFDMLIGSKVGRGISAVEYTPKQKDDPSNEIVYGVDTSNYLVYLSKVASKNAVLNPFKVTT